MILLDNVFIYDKIKEPKKDKGGKFMANNLAKIRGKHQLTQTELAEALGVTKQGVCFNETGKLSIGLAKKAAEYLHEDIFELLGTDVLVILPETEEQKKYLINLIKNL